MDFDFFEAGTALGQHRINVAPLGQQWAALFPQAGDDDRVPAALMVAILMRGYTAILDRRVPGNIHAAQMLRWGVPASAAGDLVVSLRCAAKELRGERRWLTFDALVQGDSGQHHLEAEMRFLWAV